MIPPTTSLGQATLATVPLIKADLPAFEFLEGPLRELPYVTGIVNDQVERPEVG